MSNVVLFLLYIPIKNFEYIVSMPRRPRTHIKQFVMSMLKFVSHTLFLVQTNHKWVDWNKKIKIKNSMGGSRDATDLKFRRGGHFSTFQHTSVISVKSERNKGMSN